MRAALDQFLANLTRARSLSGLVQSLSTVVTQVIDLSDVLRASLVSGVSALDHFVHELVRLGMVEVHRGLRPVTDAHLAFKVPMEAARSALADTTKDDWLDEAIREANSWVSFQHPDKIADAIRLISGVKLWEAVGADLKLGPKAVKIQLSAIVDRRNKIAHEADMDPTNPGAQWPINYQQVSDALDFIERVVRSIHKVI